MDTSAWYALANDRDRAHEAARDFLRESYGLFRRFVTTDYVLSETYTLLRMRTGVGSVLSFVSVLAATKGVEVRWINRNRHAAGLELLLARADKRWSHTDCTSFAVMDEMGIRDAFTFDENFRQAGFLVHP